MPLSGKKHHCASGLMEEDASPDNKKADDKGHRRVWMRAGNPKPVTSGAQQRRWRCKFRQAKVATSRFLHRKLQSPRSPAMP